MIRRLLGLAIVLVAGLVVYNYFFGTLQEKESSKEIFEQIKGLGQSAWDLLKSEKKKLQAGKYDGALENLQELFDQLRRQAESAGDGEALEKLNELESRSKALQGDLASEEARRARAEGSAKPDEALQSDWEQLLQETEQLMERMEH